MKTKAKTLMIVGGGKIAYSGSDSNSHIPIALKNNFTVCGILETDKYRAKFLGDKYNCKTWEDLGLVHLNSDPHLIVISTPTGKHLQNLKELLARFPSSSFLIEKPLTVSKFEVNQARKLMSENFGNFRVNYTRNYSTDFYALKRLLENEDLIYANIIYSGGLLNSGSHFLRLLMSLFELDLKIVKESFSLSPNQNSFSLLDLNSKAYLDFKALEFNDLHFGEIKVVTNRFLLSIDQGQNFNLFLRNLENDRSWPRNLKPKHKGALDDGFRQIYHNQNWLSKRNYSENYNNIMLDLATEDIIHSVLRISAIE